MPNIGTSERPELPLAVVVGAGGMGMAVARRLGQSNRLLIADRNAAHLEVQLAGLKVEGYDAATITCDVANANDVQALAARAKALGPVRVLAHVVGLSPSMGDFRTIMTVNLTGACRVADAMLPIVAPGACALFISSMAGHLRNFGPELEAVLDAPLESDFLDRVEALLQEPTTSILAYMLTKSSLNRMCRRKAKEWGDRGARIVSLSPGLIATPMGALEFERQPAKFDLLAATPIQREGTMLEIANVVEFLCSEKASFISGTDILVDGGLTGTLQTASTA